MKIEGPNALVAGGASGLGAATARRLHDAGASVTIADVIAERGGALAEELGAQFVATDVTSEADVEAAVKAAAGDDGLRISVSCAGIGPATDEYAALALHIVENTMLNGEVTRLDGALRMAAR